MAMHNDAQLEIGQTCHEQNINSGDEVEELLDHQIVSFMAKDQSQQYVPLNFIDSDEESFYSSDNYESNEESDDFINEITPDNEPNYSGRSMEQMGKEVGWRNKQTPTGKTIIELFDAQRLIFERDRLLTDLETKLKQELHENIEKQKQIRYELYHGRENIKILEPSVTRCFFKKFGMPYFADQNGFSAPPNDDHKTKIENGELVVTMIPKVRCWQKHHKEMLIEAVHKSLVEEHTVRIDKEINKLKQNLRYQKKNEDDQLLFAKIKELQNEVKCIRTRSYSDLVTKEKIDREYDWMKISVTVFNEIHSSEECRRFWHLHVKPSINKDSWKNAEDLKLLELAEEMKYEDWDAIAKLLGTGRSAYQCFVHFRTRLHSNHDFSSGKWTTEEDRKLVSVINASRIGNFIPWTKVASHMDNRTHHQIYNRWKNSLDPVLVKGRFTKEEDILIVSGIEVFGMSYKEMATLMRNRSSSQIRERYERYFLAKRVKVGTWSLEEDEKLLRLVQKHGEQNWTAISNDIKTRTRTQVRQRYSFIKRMRKTNPSWSVSQVKRRNIHKKTPVLLKTEKYVEKVKKEIEKVEEAFSLSTLERDTFRVEKLKELRDCVLLRKLEPKPKKKVCRETSKINKLLIEFFKYSLSKPPVVLQNINYSACSKEMLLLAKYFGHELKLPENQFEIEKNKALSSSLKRCLIETMNQKEDSSPIELTRDEPSCSTTLNFDSIDYSAPDTDNSLIMNQSWYNPPFDISRLNFSELFKRTIFDYSNGMHQDIWASKKKNTSVMDCNSPCTMYLPMQSDSQQQPLYMPPNLVSTTGFKSLLLSKSRLRKEVSEKGFLGRIYQCPDNGDVPMTQHISVDRALLHQFQDTMITLFTWPKVLSITSIESTPISEMSDAKYSYPSLSSNNISLINKYNLNTKIQQKKFHKTEKKMKLDQSCYREILVKKHQLSEVNKGIRYKRKMEIEHLIEKEEDAKSVVISKAERNKIKRIKKTKYKQPKCDDSHKKKLSSVHRYRKRGAEIVMPQFHWNKGSTKYNQVNTKYCNRTKTDEQSIPAGGLARITYTRSQRSKVGAGDDIDSSEPALKKTKLERNKENITIVSDSNQVEHCLDSDLTLE